MSVSHRISIRAQIFFALLAVIFMMAVVFSPYGFYTNVTSIRNSIDERLRTAVYGVRELMLDNYVDRVAQGRVSDAEYEFLRKKLTEFQEKIGVTYLYALVQSPDGAVSYVLDEELALGAPYENPSEDTLQAFRTREAVSAECPDSDYGLIARTVMLPFYTPEGRFYVIGADLNVDKIYPLVLQSLLHFLLLILLGVALGLLITIYLTSRISLPIRKLSQFTQTLAERNFSRDLKIDDEVPPRMIKTREVSLLAKSVELMRGKLDEYIEDLKREIGARNRAEQELKIAGDIQMSFLAGESFRAGAFEAAARMKTAKQAGGDLYDFFTLADGRACVAIGDVSGKGMPAALFMARAITLIRAAAAFTSELSKIVSFINDLLCQNNERSTFVTFFIAAYDAQSRKLEFVNCGHNPPYRVAADGEVAQISVKPNSVLGVFEGLSFASETLSLETGDAIVCYTDGVTEAASTEGGFYGEERLQGVLRAAAGNPPAELAERVMADVVAFERGCEQSDDITLLVLFLKPDAGASAAGAAK